MPSHFSLRLAIQSAGIDTLFYYRRNTCSSKRKDAAARRFHAAAP
ncbi:hypothetical protein HMPREF9555_01305 [Selenomonas artemidis F0399]|uniref:Uncharacterized protein n=1 Tax=Selenomonas artemidis F0399 TaxID=749551 RepID=E7N2T4_9FIRM|nr:hypothetical protein HMPREF9555_01305 [Selenomonas artemidis F0399]